MYSPWVRKIPRRREWQPTPVFFPVESHGQRSLAGYSPWGREESNRTEYAHIHTPVGALVSVFCFYHHRLKENLCTHYSKCQNSVETGVAETASLDLVGGR